MRDPNLSTSKTGSSSRQRTTTLCGEQKKIHEYVKTISPQQLQNTLVTSLAVIGLLSGLDQKKSGTEFVLTDLTDHGINLQRI